MEQSNVRKYELMLRVATPIKIKFPGITMCYNNSIYFTTITHRYTTNNHLSYGDWCNKFPLLRCSLLKMNNQITCSVLTLC